MNIKDLHQPQPEVTLKKTKKRKATSEGTSQQTPKKRGNLSAASVLNTSAIPTSIPTPASHEIPIPIPTIDETEPEDDPSEALTLRRPCTKHPKQTTSTTSELDKVLSDIDQRVSDHLSNNPNTEPEISHSPQQEKPLSPIPEEPQIP